MVLSPGARLGPYEVVAPLGFGGMGEVYRARDTRLGRDVAVKVLPSSVSADPDRLRRFELEAKAASLLNHPHIVAVYDVGTHNGIYYVVSELLEGETLGARLGTPLSSRKAVEYALQIAQGLAAAHDKGIVHRDLKPENLFVTSDGRIKILDFGLAKVSHPMLSGVPETDSPTLSRATDPGTVMGTVGYMSPEQVRGRVADTRSDIFSFGAILYEMLTGRRAFKGETAADTLTAILKEEPPEVWDTRPNVSPALARIVRHCLEKNPEARFQSARDLAFDLEAMAELSGPGSQSRVLTSAHLGRRLRMALVALALLVVPGLTFVAGRRAGEKPIPSYRQLTFRRGTVSAARFSPDGNTVFYSAAWDGHRPEVFSTRRDTVESRSLELRDTYLLGVAAGEMAVLVKSTASGAWTLARVSLGGGAPREVLEGVEEADWSPDGVSLAAVTRVERGRFRLEYPLGKPLYETNGYIDGSRVSPRGDRVAFVDHPIFGDGHGAIAVVDLTARKQMLTADWNDIQGVAWSDDGKEVWFTAARGGSARALHAVTLSGQERLLARVPGGLTLQDVRGGRALVTHNRFRTEVRVLPPNETSERDLSGLDVTFALDMSADGKTLLLEEDGEGGGPRRSVYLRRTDGSLPIRLGEGLGRALSPDGRWVISLVRTSPPQLTLLPTGAGEPRTLSRGTLVEYQWAYWFPDGRWLLILGSEAGRPSRLFVQDVGAGEPRPLTPEGTLVSQGTQPISGDGKLVAAFSSGPDGGWFAYPAQGGERRPIVGLEALDLIRWSGDGRHLFVRENWSGLPVRISRLDLSTGRREPWKELKPPDPVGVSGVTSILLTPDGQSYAYNYGRMLSDLYLVDGLK